MLVHEVLDRTKGRRECQPCVIDQSWGERGGGRLCKQFFVSCAP